MYQIDSTRPTVEKVTTSGLKFTVVEYITAKDLRYIEEPLYSAMEMKPSVTGEQQMNSFKGTIVTDMQDRRFEVSVVSVDGQNDSILERVLGLKLQDFNDIKDVVSEVTGEKKA